MRIFSNNCFFFKYSIKLQAECDLRVAQSEFDRQAEITKLLLEGISTSQSSHLRHLHAFVEAQVTIKIILKVSQICFFFLHLFLNFRFRYAIMDSVLAVWMIYSVNWPGETHVYFFCWV